LIEPPFKGGIGNSVFGAEAEAGAGLLLVTSVLLQPKETQMKTKSKRICGLNSLNIILQAIIANLMLVLFAGKLFAGHSILSFDPTAEIDELATFRTEWTKGIVFPLGRFTAGWALHESRNISVNAKLRAMLVV
jgi:hypothetical protein